MGCSLHAETHRKLFLTGEAEEEVVTCCRSSETEAGSRSPAGAHQVNVREQHAIDVEQWLHAPFELQAAYDARQLHKLPSEETRKVLNDLLVRVRLQKRS